jgi:hypothetical protein
MSRIFIGFSPLLSAKLWIDRGIMAQVHTYDFLNKRVRYAIESATARYPIIEIKLAMVEAMKG